LIRTDETFSIEPAYLGCLSGLHELRLADLLTLLAVHRAGSISGAARELRVTPSQVSKAMARLERHFGMRLLSRGARGVVPTAAGRQVLPHIVSAIDELTQLIGMREDQVPSLELTVAGPSYLVAIVLPAVMSLLPRVRVRGLEMAPAQVRARIAENLFDVALSPGGIENRPAAWTSDGVGPLRIGLFARPAYAKRLGPMPLTEERVRPLPFIGPAKVVGDTVSTTGDDCPVPIGDRWIAHEVQTIGAALEFACRSDHVVFGPHLAARRHVKAGALVELPVSQWDVFEPLQVLCNSDRVLSRVRTAVLQAASEAICDPVPALRPQVAQGAQA
jgi:DNA-binding transcriptional LysR family regulator